MKTLFRRFIDSFIWGNWEEIGEQIDSYSREVFVIMKRENKNSLVEFKKVVKISASCHAFDLKIDPTEKK